MRTPEDALSEIARQIERHARPDAQSRIDGLLLARALGSTVPDYGFTEPLLIVMAQGGKRLHLGEEAFEYRAGQAVVVAASLPVTGEHLDRSRPTLGVGLELRPAAIAELLLRAPGLPGAASGPAIATADADLDLLDAFARMVRLLDRPRDIPVLAPMLEQEILWRALNGPLGPTLRQIGVADGHLAHLNRAIAWIRENFAEPMRVEDLARVAGMSVSAFHRQFRSATAMSPLQFQKQIRLQTARTLLMAALDDVAGVGHRVGYDSPSQFSREYRRMFGAPPGQDAARLRDVGLSPEPALLP